MFGKISKSPKLLKNCADPIGKDNDNIILSATYQWSVLPSWDLCFGWGDGGDWKNRNLEVFAMIRSHCLNRKLCLKENLPPLSLGLTKKGNPRHPLYVSKNKLLRPFK